MGGSNFIVLPQQTQFTELKGKVAFLGWDKYPKHFKTNNYDLYDIILGNWDINSNWELKQKYDTIVCYRTLFFCKDIKCFFKKCYEYLNENGGLYIDFHYGSVGKDMHKKIGDSVGFIKNGIQQYTQYQTVNNNLIISPCITSYWSDELKKYEDYKKFKGYLLGRGYVNIEEAVKEEIPVLVEDKDFREYFIKDKMQVNYVNWDRRATLLIYIKLKKI